MQMGEFQKYKASGFSFALPQFMIKMDLLQYEKCTATVIACKFIRNDLNRYLTLGRQDQAFVC